jgi:chemotaxis protein MotB
MSADHHPEIVIVRRRGGLEHAHHGGAWKIAFADFMTAMMAFFLVLWIISATDKNTKTIIARYFNPVRVEEPARALKGVHGADDSDAQAKGGTPVPAGGEKSRPDRGEASQKSPAQAEDGALKNGKNDHGSSAQPQDPAKPAPTMSEDQLLSDPQTSLDRIAGAPPGPHVEQASAPLGGSGDMGTKPEDSYRDPFRPRGSAEGFHAAAATDAPPQDDATSVVEAAPAPSSQAKKSDSSREQNQKPAAAKPDVSKAGAAVDETKPSPEPAPGNSEAARTDEASAPPSESARERAAALLVDLKRRLGPEMTSISGPKLDVQATDEGILISLTDRENFSMFAIGSAEPQPRVVHMMDAIATSLAAIPGAIIVRGHTDAHPYRNARYDNWRLSSARAQMAYYMLIRAGVPEKRFERIEGFADHRLRNPAKPFAAENRRIEVLVREAKP